MRTVTTTITWQCDLCGTPHRGSLDSKKYPYKWTIISDLSFCPGCIKEVAKGVSFTKKDICELVRTYLKEHPIPCDECEGQGKSTRCTHCGGLGFKSDDSYSTFQCPWCEKGKVKEYQCSWCNGTGKLITKL